LSRAGSVGRRALAALVVCAVLSPLSQSQGPLYPQPADRFGVAVRSDFGEITDYDVASLHIAWYSDWAARVNPPRPAGIEYAQLVWVSDGVFSPSLDQLAPMVDANLGSVWMIGNEPECIWQGNNTPEQYAQAYHQLYTFIKDTDPTAQVAIGGVVQPTPLRLRWLDRVLDHYQATYGEPMPVDVWNIHNMILPEVRGGWGCDIPRGLTEDSGRLYTVDDNDSVDYFVQHVVDFRTWMRDRGQRDKPLIITEYGVLMPVEYGLTPQRVNAFMNATFDYLLTARDNALGYPADENRLVQRWLWFSLNDPPWDPATGAGFNGALFDHRFPGYPGVLTEFGINFKQYMGVLTLPPTPTNTPTSEPTKTATVTPTATQAATATATPRASATPTVTPPVDLVLTGLVYDAAVGSEQPIAEAVVSVDMCVPRAFQAVSGQDGRYNLLLPADYLNVCTHVTLQGWATGYQSVTEAIAVAGLQAQPVRDIGLYPTGWSSPTPTGLPTATPTPTSVAPALLSMSFKASSAGRLAAWIGDWCRCMTKAAGVSPKGRSLLAFARTFWNCLSLVGE
jgi:hypothetical protein